MGWYGSMSGLGHEPPTFEEWNSSPNTSYEEGTAEYEFYQNYYESTYPTRNRKFHFGTSPHPWVAHHKSIGYVDIVTENGELGVYKTWATYSKEELTIALRGAGKTDYQINNWFRTGKWGSSEPGNWSDVGKAILLFIVLPTIFLNLPSNVPLSPRWFGKTLGLE